jgi:hypothetical protein
MVPVFVVGWTIIAFGATRALGDARDAHPFALLVHVVAFDLLHDVVVAPALFLGAWLIGKVLPPVSRGPVRAAAAASALFVLFSYPLVRRWGKRPTNSSTLPLEYGRNLAIVLIVVWALAGAAIVWRTVNARREVTS